MKKLIGIIILGLIFVANAYSDDPYFQEQHGFSVCESCIIEKFKNDNI